MVRFPLKVSSEKESFFHRIVLSDSAFAGALDYTSAFHLCGDIHEKAYVKTGDNVKVRNKRSIHPGKRKATNCLSLKAIEEETGKCHKVDVVRWDVTTIPLRTASVDVFVSDLVSDNLGTLEI